MEAFGRITRDMANETLTETETAAIVEEINATEYSEADLAAARAFLGRFAYTTTAVYALSVALSELESEATAEILRAASAAIAPIEATEI